MPNPFDKKKLAPKPDAPTPDAPAPDAPAPDDLPEDLQLKPAEAKPGETPPEGEAKPASTPGDSKGKGSSAPMTPGQGEPDVKPHDQPGAKAEPEADKQKLPDEADTADAKPKPTGLPSLASMTKAEAEASNQDPLNNPHIQRLVTLVQGLAKVVQDHQARLGAMSVPGQAMPSEGQQAGQFKPGMPGAKPMGAARPGLPAKPGMPAPGKPGMPAAPGMKPGAPGVAPGVAPGAPAPASNTLSLEQLTSMMGIIEAAGSSRISRQAAAIMISQGFGIDLKTASSMVAAETSGASNPDALALGAAMAGDPGDDMNPEEEEMEGVDEENAEEAEEEPDLQMRRRRMAADDADEEDVDEDGFPFGIRRRQRGDAFEQSRDELGRFADEGGKGAKASVGSPFIVYRLAKAGQRDLNNRNAGNAQSVAHHIGRNQSMEGASPPGGYGDTVHAYRVTTKSEFGPYTRMNMGKPTDHDGKQVGRHSKDPHGMESSAISYSFPENGEFEAEHLTEIPVSKLNDHVKEMAKTYEGGKYAASMTDFEGAGSLFGGEVIRDRVRNALLEKEITEGNRGIPREKMPQIPKEAMGEFFDMVAEKGATIEKGSSRVSDLKPTQSSMNMSKVIGMRTMSKEKLAKPVIVSSDGYILDGHHRWAALKLNDPNAQIATVNVGMPIDDLVREAQGFKKAEYKTVHDAADRNDEWDEASHPRDEGGRFGDGGGGNKGGDKSGGGVRIKSVYQFKPHNVDKTYSINKVHVEPAKTSTTHGLPAGYEYSKGSLETFEGNVAEQVAMGVANPDRREHIKEIEALSPHAGADRMFGVHYKVSDEELKDPAVVDRLRQEHVFIKDRFRPLANVMAEDARPKAPPFEVKDKPLNAEQVANHESFQRTGIREFADADLPDGRDYRSRSEFATWAQKNGLNSGVLDKDDTAQSGQESLFSPLEKHVIIQGHYTEKLRNSSMEDLAKTSPTVHKEIKELDKLIQDHTLKENVKVYRGVVHGPLTEAKPGDVVTDQGFMATSVSKVAAAQFSRAPVDAQGNHVPHGQRTLVEIVAPRGTNAAVGDHGDGELLFARGQKLKILSATDAPGGLRHVKAELVTTDRKDEWDEAAHPRGENGQFGDGGGGTRDGKGPGSKSAPVDPLKQASWSAKPPPTESGLKKRVGELEALADKAYAAGRDESGNKHYENGMAANRELWALQRANRPPEVFESLGQSGSKDRLAILAKDAAFKAKMAAASKVVTIPKSSPELHLKVIASAKNLKELAARKIVDAQNLGGGANVTKLVTLDNGEKAVWKPAYGEDGNLRSNIKGGTYYVREAAAAEVARLIGVQDLVPAVARHDGADRIPPHDGEALTTSPFATDLKDGAKDATSHGHAGSLHTWAEGVPLVQAPTSMRFDREAAERMRVFDYVTGNSDRHAGNVLVQERDGKHMPVLIDNGLAFPNGAPDRFIQPMHHVEPHDSLLPSTKAMIDKIDILSMAEALKDMGIEREAATHAVRRTMQIQRDPKLLHATSDNGSQWSARAQLSVDDTETDADQADAFISKYYGDLDDDHGEDINDE